MAKGDSILLDPFQLDNQVIGWVSPFQVDSNMMQWASPSLC